MIDRERAKILTATLDRAMVRAVPDAKVRDELAFHVADVLRDFLQIESTLEKAFEGKELTREDLDGVLSLMVTHWPYHLKAIVRLRKRMEGQPPSRE